MAKQKYHRMNICIEVPAIEAPGIDPTASFVRFSDMIMYIQGMVERSKPGDTEIRASIAGAHFQISTEHGVESEINPDTPPEQDGGRRKR